MRRQVSVKQIMVGLSIFSQHVIDVDFAWVESEDISIFGPQLDSQLTISEIVELKEAGWEWSEYAETWEIKT